MDRETTPSGEHPSRQERAAEVASMIQQAQSACRAAGADLGDSRGQQLFEKIAGYLDVAIQALQSYEREAAPPSKPRIVH
jgi:hypothetical protein